MNIIVTGAGGFLGSRLVQRLLDRGHLVGASGTLEPIGKIIAIDLGFNEQFPDDPRLHRHQCDIATPGLLQEMFEGDTISSVFHLASVVSGQAEAEFDVGMASNWDASRSLMDVARLQSHCPRIVFASSCAVYGGDPSMVITDKTDALPKSSYGMQKRMIELYMTDLSRRGWIDGRCLRLPTVSIRPGKPNAAASSFASGVLREPLTGHQSSCPVRASTAMFLRSPALTVESFIHAHELPKDAWKGHPVTPLPGITVTVQDMIDVLRRVGGARIADRVTFDFKPEIDAIVQTWPPQYWLERPQQLGFTEQGSLLEIVYEFCADQQIDLNNIP